MKRKIFIILFLFFSAGIFFFSEQVGKETLGTCFKVFFAFVGNQSELPYISRERLASLIVNQEKEIFLPFFEEKRQEMLLKKIDFLEINLSEMRARIYKNGLLIKDVSILAKGDAQNWGGAAVGLYEILRGFVNAYSIVSEVYMPWSLHFYGKYYLHGEPYYPGGQPLISKYSGGCLRLSNDDAKDIFELTEKSMPVLVIDKPRDDHQYQKEATTDFPELSAKSYLVADLDSGYVFSQKNIEEQLPIASLTKLMTAVVVSENVDLTKTISVQEPMLEAYGSTNGLEAGKRFSVVELFYPLLIESSNDAAEALSHFLGRDRTIRMMNEKAKAMMMEQTEFVCPSGYDPGNISTAKDLFYLARYIFNNRPPLLEITKGKEVRSFGEIGFDIENMWNKNIFINDPTFVGGKTGFIISSRYTNLFIFHLTAEDEVDRNVVIILLGSENQELDTQKAYIWLLENYFQGSE